MTLQQECDGGPPTDEAVPKTFETVPAMSDERGVTLKWRRSSEGAVKVRMARSVSGSADSHA
jgi:hypothetical protein